MPGTDVLDEIDLVVEDIGHGGGGKPPERDEHRGGGGDDGSFRPRRPSPSQSGQRRYQTAILLGMVSICMFFMALSAAFLVRKTGKDWVNFKLPSIIWVNTIVLLTSSLTIDLARRRLALNDLVGFKTMWRATTALGGAENWAAESGAKSFSNDSSADEAGANTDQQVGRFIQMLPESQYQLTDIEKRLRATGGAKWRKS